MKITKAEFVTGAADVNSIPAQTKPEVAFAGKSNVGKSSLINKIVGRKNLAIASSTPGRTRQINFFNINDFFYFVDLPGYGFAKVGRSEKQHWGNLISKYLESRSALVAVVVIIDIRRDPDELDKSLLEMLDEFKIEAFIVCTKADKVGRGQWEKRRKEIADGLGIAKDRLFVFSAESGEGKDKIMSALLKKIREIAPAGESS